MEEANESLSFRQFLPLDASSPNKKKEMEEEEEEEVEVAYRMENLSLSGRKFLESSDGSLPGFGLLSSSTWEMSSQVFQHYYNEQIWLIT